MNQNYRTQYSYLVVDLVVNIGARQMNGSDGLICNIRTCGGNYYSQRIYTKLLSVNPFTRFGPCWVPVLVSHKARLLKVDL